MKVLALSLGIALFGSLRICGSKDASPTGAASGNAASRYSAANKRAAARRSSTDSAASCSIVLDVLAKSTGSVRRPSEAVECLRPPWKAGVLCHTARSRAASAASRSRDARGARSAASDQRF